MEQAQDKQQQIKVRYNETTAQYGSQFIINASGEDIIINFSSGPLSDPGASESILPIHTRIAMTREGAKRLQAVLAKVLSEQPPSNGAIATDQAQFPKMQ